MMALRVATRKFTSVTMLVVGCGSRVVPPRPVGPTRYQHLNIQTFMLRVFTMDIGRINFSTAERLQ